MGEQAGAEERALGHAAPCGPRPWGSSPTKDDAVLEHRLRQEGNISW